MHVDRIFHITSAEAWRAAQGGGAYRVSTRGLTLEQVGFIHASRAEQILPVANRFFAGLRGLVLLVIDRARVAAPVRDDVVENGETFPHIHGPLNLDAVVEVLPFEPDAGGAFTLPASVARHGPA